MSALVERWTPSSWRRYPAQQQPDWPDTAALDVVLGRLARQPPLVFAGEVRDLTVQLARAARGEAFLLQGGDCAETFQDFSADAIRDKVKVLLQMSTVLTYGASMPVIKVGRIAGQFATPRSASVEQVAGVDLPVYRGDAVNSLAPHAEARRPDPTRLQQVYHQSVSTLNLLRAFAGGGLADLRQVHAWNQEFVQESPQGQQYARCAQAITRSLDFLEACGFDIDADGRVLTVDLFTSHEALLLGYEEALTRQDSITGEWYDCSAHLLWCGERTRDPDGAHVAFLSGIANPVAVKLGPTATLDEISVLAERLNPDNTPGRLTLITRMGATGIEQLLPPLVAGVRDRGHEILWSCDPCHGNTFTTSSGHKTRRFADVMAEIHGFFAVHAGAGTIPGGVHLEFTGEDVTECLGGGQSIAETDLAQRYRTACDPRLNNRQSLEVAFQIAQILSG